MAWVLRVSLNITGTEGVAK